MAEQFIVKGVDVMTQDSMTALEMLHQEWQVIEYYYNKDREVRETGFDRFMKLIQVMMDIADPDDDDQMSYVFQAVFHMLNFFDSDLDEGAHKEGALGILDYMMQHGIDFTEKRYCGSERTTVRDYLIKKVYEKRALIEKMSRIGVDMDKALVDGRTLVHTLIHHDRYGSPLETDEREQELADLMEYFSVESMEELDKDGLSAVHTAARENHYEVLEAMIRKGVNVNITSDSPAVAGSTPLHMACEHGYPKIVQMLMDAGADDTILNVKEETPAHVAVSKKISYKEITEAERVQMIKALKHIDIPGRGGQTPLMFAQDRNLYITATISPLLIEKGADVNRRDNDGNNAMMHNGQWHCSLSVLKSMVAAGLDINARNNDGDTVLHMLLRRNSIQPAIYLIKKGADYNIANQKKVTAMQIAVEDGQSDVVELMDI